MKKHVLTGMALGFLAFASVNNAAGEKPTSKPAAAKQEMTEEKPQPKEAVAEKVESKASEFKTLEERVSYAIGLQLSQEFKNAGFDLKPELVAAGMTDIFEGAEPKMTEEDMANTMQEMQMKMMEQMQAQQGGMNQGGDMAAQIEENKAAGAAFLEKNKDKEGVTTTETGLQYEILEEGEGTPPGLTDNVKVHYKGMLLDGTEFDSSYGGEPATFKPTGVIAGWTEALQLMKPGAKYKLYIPSDLAYGDGGRPPVIPPASLLVFEVELVEVVK